MPGMYRWPAALYRSGCSAVTWNARASFGGKAARPLHQFAWQVQGTWRGASCRGHRLPAWWRRRGSQTSAHCLPAISFPELTRTLARRSRRHDAPGCGSTHLVREGELTEGRAPGTRMRLRMGCHPGCTERHRVVRPDLALYIPSSAPRQWNPRPGRLLGEPGPRGPQRPPYKSLPPPLLPPFHSYFAQCVSLGAQAQRQAFGAHLPTRPIAPPTPLRLAPGAPTLRCDLWKQQQRVQGDGAVQMQPAPARSCTAAAAWWHHSSPPQPSAAFPQCTVDDLLHPRSPLPSSLQVAMALCRIAALAVCLLALAAGASAACTPGEPAWCAVPVVVPEGWGANVSGLRLASQPAST